MPFWEYVNTFSDRCIMMNKISLVSLVVQSSISYLFSTKLNLNQRPSVCDNEFHSNKKWIILNIFPPRKCIKKCCLQWWPYWLSSEISWHIEAKTIWPPLSRRHCRMHLLECKRMNFDYDFTEFCPKGRINNTPTLVQKKKAWRRRGDKPLSEPMMVSLLAHIMLM